jgi:hypothetical protein
MIQNNEGLNTSRLVGNNGADFIEDTDTHTGCWYGFQPHNLGCKVAEVDIENAAGDAIDEDDVTWAATTLNLDCWIPAGIVSAQKGYITAIKLTSGACTLYRDTKSK